MLLLRLFASPGKSRYVYRVYVGYVAVWSGRVRYNEIGPASFGNEPRSARVMSRVTPGELDMRSSMLEVSRYLGGYLDI